jgi:hypothetical protein
MHHAQVAEQTSELEGDQKKFSRYSYPEMRRTQGSFTLDIEAGEFTDRCGGHRLPSARAMGGQSLWAPEAENIRKNR